MSPLVQNRTWWYVCLFMRRCTYIMHLIKKLQFKKKKSPFHWLSALLFIAGVNYCHSRQESATSSKSWNFDWRKWSYISQLPQRTRRLVKLSCDCIYHLTLLPWTVQTISIILSKLIKNVFIQNVYIKTHKRLKYEHFLFGQEKAVCSFSA